MQSCYGSSKVSKTNSSNYSGNEALIGLLSFQLQSGVTSQCRKNDFGEGEKLSRTSSR